ncbi:hypothetical protein N869_07060, partial [Cellulomonas bogoriensis 69B4 = DSM 16987]
MPSHALPRRRPQRAHRPIAATLVGALAGALVAVGAPAAFATPMTVDYPTVFISQLIQAGDPDYVGAEGTTMRTAVQSRLANAGAGGVEIRSIGTAAPFLYNAVGYRVSDGYLYGMQSNSNTLVRIGDGAEVTALGAVTGLPSGTYAAGAFGEGAEADTFFVKTNQTTSPVYAIDVDTRTVTRTITPSTGFNSIDFTWADGYLWGVRTSAAVKTLIRLDTTTGEVLPIATGTVFPAGDTGGYGAAWTYGNGNLAFSNNSTGNITQVTVTDPTGSAPEVTWVSTISGPPTSSNDGATTPSEPTDLVPMVTDPAPAGPATPLTWEVEITNAGPGGSSGSTFTFAVPEGVTDVTLPLGCSTTQGVVQCVAGQLAPGDSETYTFTGTSPADRTVSSTSVVTVVGNEEDPGVTTAPLTVTPLTRHLTSSGVGTTVQTVPSGAPDGGQVTLLDAQQQPVQTLDVPGQGTYRVQGPDLVFEPVLGFAGEATTVDVRLTAPGAESTETGTATYTATVHAPAGPTATDRTSTGVGTEVQDATLPTAPTGGALTLLDADGEPATTVTVTGQGTYALDGTTVTFSPVHGFAGTATAVSYRLTDAYGQTAEATYTPTVAAPAPPATADLTSQGVGTTTQVPTSQVPVPVDGSVTLLDGDGSPTSTVTVPGQGTYT